MIFFSRRNENNNVYIELLLFITDFNFFLFAVETPETRFKTFSFRRLFGRSNKRVEFNSQSRTIIKTTDTFHTRWRINRHNTLLGRVYSFVCINVYNMHTQWCSSENVYTQYTIQGVSDYSILNFFITFLFSVTTVILRYNFMKKKKLIF